MRNVLLVAIGGAVGASARFLITHWMHRRWASPFPIGTLTVNVLGCFLIGLAVQASHAAVLSPQARMLLVPGVLGALTTFSTFGHDTLHTFDQHSWRLAVTNVVANLVLGLGAVVLGIMVGRWIWPISRG